MDQAQQFRDAIAERFGERRPARYPKDLRELALEYLADKRRVGSKLSDAAKTLGIDPNTLRSWSQREQAVAEMQRVVVNASSKARSSCCGSARLTVRSH